jgi:4-hydroxyphenylacetate 3-monooxygenase
VALRTGPDYEAALRDGRQVYVDGTLIDDVTACGPLARTVRTVAGLYDLQHDAGTADRLTFRDEDGGRVSGAWIEPRTQEDLQWRRHLIEAVARRTGALFGRSVEYVPLFLLGMYDLRREFSQGNEQFEDNICRYWRYARDRDLSLAHAFVTEQADPTKPLARTDVPRIVDRNDEGIVIRGIYTIATFAPYADECFFGTFPRPNLTDDYVHYYALPLNAPGLRIVTREGYGEDNPVNSPAGRFGDENDSMVIMDDVLVPWDRVFSIGNPGFCVNVFPRISQWAHWGILARMAVKAELIAGLLHLLPDMIGRGNNPYVHEVQGEAIRYLVTIRGLLSAAEEHGRRTDAGHWQPNGAYVTAGRAYSVEHYRRLIGYIQDVGAQGLINMPTEATLADPAIGPWLNHLLSSPASEASARVRAFRLALELSSGAVGGRSTLFELFNASPWTSQRAQLTRRVNTDPLKDFARLTAGILPPDAAGKISQDLDEVIPTPRTVTPLPD